MCVRKTYDAQNIILRECAEYSLSHSQSVAIDNYLGVANKKIYALTHSSWYRAQMGLTQELVIDSEMDNAFVTMSQSERYKSSLQKISDNQLELWVETQEEKDVNKKVKLNCIINDAQKVSVIRAAKKAFEDGFYISAMGDPLKVLLTGQPLKNINTVKFILRFITILPSHWDSIRILHKNLIEYASLIAHTGLSCREIEYKWSEKICESFNRLRTAPKIVNACLVKEFGELAEVYGNTYLMGNKKLIHQFHFWIARFQMKQKQIENASVVISAPEIFQALNEKKQEILEAQSKKNCKETSVTVPEVEVDQDHDNASHFTPVKIRFKGEAVITPNKENMFKTSLQKDSVKIQLFEQFLKFSTDPLLKNTAGGLRKALKEQCCIIRNGAKDEEDWVIKPQKVWIKGQELRWKDVCRDSSALAEIFERTGFEAQGWRKQRTQKSGLHFILRDFMEKKYGHEASTSLVRENEKEIFEEAKRIADC